ncbi:MAG: FG-GAP-like repeat-containing protein [Xenococcaceae cyanobacterium MO_167.B52]|nr:FG-GAP-like repeat-containing protein [Xenococcaceae cyanobacterium MO_167.B52]
MVLNNNSFEDVTDSAGIIWSRHRGNEAFSIAWIDYNNDGLLDLWISGHGHNNTTPQNPTGKFPALYLNNGDGSFTNLFTEDWRQGSGGDIHGSTWSDFDNDGDQDVFSSGGGQLGQTNTGQANLFFVNNGGTLSNEAAARNLEYSIARSRSSLWVDVNNDGRLDMIQLVALRNDGRGANAYFRQLANGTFAAPQNLNLSGGSRYAQLGDLTGDGHPEIVIQGTYEYPIAVFDISSGNPNEITNQFNFPLTSNQPSSITADFFNRTSAKDSIIADFDNDGDNDFFLTRSDVAQDNLNPTVFKSGNNIIGADLLNKGQEIGFSFQTNGQIAIDIFDIFEREPNLNASQIFIGSSGRNPTAAELAAFSSTDTPTSVNLLVNNTNRPSLVLNANSSGVTGLKSNSSARGVYISYNPNNQTWQIRLSSGQSEILRAVVESTQTVNNVTPINFNNPNLNSRGLTDQLWLNNSQGQFINNSTAAGFTTPTLSQSAVAGDFDNDKDLDIYVANSYTSLNQPNILYENQGDGTFTIVEMAGGAAGGALGPVHLDFNMGSRLAVADYDNDGFLDIFAGSTVVKSPRKTYLSSPSQLFRNQGNNNNWLQIDLEGITSNRDAVGAQVKLTSGGLTQLREQNGGTHAFAQNSQRLHFGLGQDEIVDKIEVRFPSGTTLVFNNVDINQIITIKEDGTLIGNVGDNPNPNPDPNNGELIAEFQFEGNSTTTVTDSSPSGKNNSGTFNNGATRESLGGDFGNVASFDGGDDYIEIPNSTDINSGIQEKRTVSLWFQANELNITNRKQVLYEEGGGERGLNIYLDSGQLYVGGWNIPESGWSGTYLATDQIASKQWHHVALVLEGGNTLQSNVFTAYLDGQAFDQGPGSQLWSHVNPIGIGNINGSTKFHTGNSSGLTNGFAGQIDQVQIYNRALSATDVNNIYTAITPPIPPTPTDEGLIAYLEFNETSGTLAADSSASGQNNPGRLLNGADFTTAPDNLTGFVNFDGVDDYVELANSTDINSEIQDKRTISLWFQADQINITNRKQVLYEEGGGTRGLNIYLDSGQLYVGGWNIPESSWSGTYLATNQISSEQWHHVALVLDGGNTLQPNVFTAYLDGQAFAQGQGSQLWSHVDPIGLGSVNGATRFHDGVSNTNNSFAGNLDELQIYNRALDNQEVENLFTSFSNSIL